MADLKLKKNKVKSMSKVKSVKSVKSQSKSISKKKSVTRNGILGTLGVAAVGLTAFLGYDNIKKNKIIGELTKKDKISVDKISVDKISIDKLNNDINVYKPLHEVNVDFIKSKDNEISKLTDINNITRQENAGLLKQLSELHTLIKKNVDSEEKLQQCNNAITIYEKNEQWYKNEINKMKNELTKSQKSINTTLHAVNKTSEANLANKKFISELKNKLEERNSKKNT